MAEIPCLECRDFSFHYGDKRILDRISFAIPQGVWLSIIGPNASGKSTLLKNMLRLTEGGKSGGSLLLNGKPREAYSQKELARILAYAPQAGGRIPPFSVRDFVNLSRYPYIGHAAGKENFLNEAMHQALELTDTAHLMERRMDTLSGGQLQRVYLAAALAQNTPILLLDEPAAFLDPRHVKLINESLKKLHAMGGLSIISVTHDLNQLFDVGGKVLAIKDGKQIFFGETERLLKGEGILERIFNCEFSYLEHPRTQKPLVFA